MDLEVEAINLQFPHAPAPKIYFLAGIPEPLRRGRAAIANNQAKKIVVYDSQKKKKLADGLYLRQQHKDTDPLNGPLILHAIFFFPLPKSVKHNRRQDFIGAYHHCRPDLDNLVKYICDLAQEVGIIKDDGQICLIKSKKVYDTTPRTEFYFKEI